MPPITPVKNVWTPILVGIFMAIAIVACGFLFNVQDKPFWIKEGGVVETLSALGYFVTVATMLLLGGFQFIKRYYYIVLLILIFGMRELDFDKRFTTMGIFKSRFYLSDAVPLYEKVIGLLVIAVLAWITFQLFRHHFRGLFSNLFKSPVNVGVLLTGMLLIFSKTIDGTGSKARRRWSNNFSRDQCIFRCG